MTLQLMVPNRACLVCSNTITKAIRAVNASNNSKGTHPDATAQANTKTKQINVETQTAETVIKQVIVDAGYTVA